MYVLMKHVNIEDWVNTGDLASALPQQSWDHKGMNLPLYGSEYEWKQLCLLAEESHSFSPWPVFELSAGKLRLKGWSGGGGGLAGQLVRAL